MGLLLTLLPPVPCLRVAWPVQLLAGDRCSALRGRPVLAMWDVSREATPTMQGPSNEWRLLAEEELLVNMAAVRTLMCGGTTRGSYGGQQDFIMAKFISVHSMERLWHLS